MNHQADPTRAPATRRRVGGALLAFPSLRSPPAAAGAAAAATTAARRARRTSSTSRTGRSTSTRTSRRRRSPTLEQFTEKTGITVNYYEDDQLERRVLREDPGPALAGQGDRPRHLRLHRQLAVPRASTSPRSASQKLDKSLIPNIDNLIDAQQSPPFDPNRDYSLPWLIGHRRDRLERGAHRRPGHERSTQLLRRTRS